MPTRDGTRVPQLQRSQSAKIANIFISLHLIDTRLSGAPTNEVTHAQYHIPGRFGRRRPLRPFPSWTAVRPRMENREQMSAGLQPGALAVSDRHYVDWPAIFGGAAVAIAIGVLATGFGAALGVTAFLLTAFSAVSPIAGRVIHRTNRCGGRPRAATAASSDTSHLR